MRILAVDDEPYILELIPMLATRVGFPEVATAPSGPLALDALTGHGASFDCLLLDINMPDMDGIELCGRIRLIDRYRKTPIIMLTAMSERKFIDAAFKAGATDYVTKPFDIHELGARLRIARELVEARREAETAKHALTATGSAIAKAKSFDIPDAITIEGVANLVDFDSLKNYLRQCSRAGLAASQAIAAKIDRIDHIVDQATLDEVAYALGEVAHAISDALQTREALMSYAGRGIFVVVSSSAPPLSAIEIEAEVQHLLDDKNSEYDSGSPMDLEVSVGNPVSPNFGDVADVPRSIERAIARAEERSIAKRGQPRAVNIRRLGSQDR
jgi:CheY-like chemotaxis protein